MEENKYKINFPKVDLEKVLTSDYKTEEEINEILSSSNISIDEKIYYRNLALKYKEDVEEYYRAFELYVMLKNKVAKYNIETLLSLVSNTRIKELLDVLINLDKDSMEEFDRYLISILKNTVIDNKYDKNLS